MLPESVTSSVCDSLRVKNGSGGEGYLEWFTDDLSAVTIYYNIGMQKSYGMRLWFTPFVT